MGKYTPVSINSIHSELPKSNPIETVPDPKNFESAKTEYTSAVIKYNDWSFSIHLVDWSSMVSEYAITVRNKIFDTEFHLIRPSTPYYELPHRYPELERFTSLDDAKNYVRDFINNELQ